MSLIRVYNAMARRLRVTTAAGSAPLPTAIIGALQRLRGLDPSDGPLASYVYAATGPLYDAAVDLVAETEALRAIILPQLAPIDYDVVAALDGLKWGLGGPGAVALFRDAVETTTLSGGYAGDAQLDPLSDLLSFLRQELPQ